LKVDALFCTSNLNMQIILMHALLRLLQCPMFCSDAHLGSAREAAARISTQLGQKVRGYVLCGADLLQTKGTYDKAHLVVMERDAAPYTAQMKKARAELAVETVVARSSRDFASASSTAVRALISKGEAAHRSHLKHARNDILQATGMACVLVAC